MSLYSHQALHINTSTIDSTTIRQKHRRQIRGCMYISYFCNLYVPARFLTVDYSLNIETRIEVCSSVTIVHVSSISAAIYSVAKEEIIIPAKEVVITSATNEA